jgi:hypothetical protein
MDCQICTPEERSICLCRYAEFSFFREWMASGDELKRRHVRERSKLPYTPPLPELSTAASQNIAAHPRTEPGIRQKASTFVAALKEHSAAGFPVVSPDVAGERLAICHSCPGGHYLEERQACILCGCYMPLKATWAEQACPQGYWPRVV